MEMRTLAYWPGRKLLSGFGKQSRHADGAGFDVDLAIREVEVPVLRIDRPIRQNELQIANFSSRRPACPESSSAV